MTLAKAQACVSAIIGAGFDATVHKSDDGVTWTVRASSVGFDITSAQIDFLVTNQAVIGKVSIVEFS